MPGLAGKRSAARFDLTSQPDVSTAWPNAYGYLIMHHPQPGPMCFPGPPTCWERGLPARGGPEARHGPRGQDARAPSRLVFPT